MPALPLPAQRQGVQGEPPGRRAPQEDGVLEVRPRQRGRHPPVAGEHPSAAALRVVPRHQGVPPPRHRDRAHRDTDGPPPPACDLSPAPAPAALQEDRAPRRPRVLELLRRHGQLYEGRQKARHHAAAAEAEKPGFHPEPETAPLRVGDVHL